MSIQSMLRGQTLFRSLTPNQVARVESLSTMRQCVAGDVVHRAGDDATTIFLLVEGKIHLRLPSSRNINVVISEVGMGELFGLSSLLGSPRHTVTAICDTPCAVLQIDAKGLLTVLDEDSRTGLHIIRGVARAYFDRYVGVTRRLQSIVDQIPIAH